MSIAEKEQIMSANNVTIAENQQKVYDAGVKAEYDKFWDAYQIIGRTRTGNYMFYSYEWDGNYRSWDDSNFYPKYDIYPSGECAFMFNALGVTDLSTRIKECEIKLDLSRATNVRYMFNRAKTKIIPEMNFSGVNVTTGIQRAFSYSSIEEIEKLILPNNNKIVLNDMFLEATKLTHIIIDGSICNTISFQYSPLNVDSMKSVITHLYNYSAENPATYTVTFNSDCWANLESSGKPYDDGLTNDESFTWQEYVFNDLGWNT